METKRTILVVDDDMDTLHLLDKVLSHYGYVILPASNGREGLLLGEKCDAAFIDFSLPDMDGQEVARELRQKRGAAFPLFAMTANSFSVIQEKFPDAVTLFTAFFIKPFHYEELIALLQKKLA